MERIVHVRETGGDPEDPGSGRRPDSAGRTAPPAWVARAAVLTFLIVVALPLLILFGLAVAAAALVFGGLALLAAAAGRFRTSLPGRNERWNVRIRKGGN